MSSASELGTHEAADLQITSRTSDAAEHRVAGECDREIKTDGLQTGDLQSESHRGSADWNVGPADWNVGPHFKIPSEYPTKTAVLLTVLFLRGFHRIFIA